MSKQTIQDKIDILEHLVEDVKYWSNINSWQSPRKPGDSSWVGHLDRENNEFYELFEIDAEFLYDAPKGTNESLAEYYAAVNPTTIKELLEYIRYLEGKVNLETL